MHSEWYQFGEETPPEGAVILVHGTLGVDLAITLDSNLYFKKGDDWNPKNLEYWNENKPTLWTELTMPDGEYVDLCNIMQEIVGERSSKEDCDVMLFMEGSAGTEHEISY